MKKIVEDKVKDKFLEKSTKASVVIVTVNLVVAPLYFFDANVGIAASLAVNGLLLYKLNEMGSKVGLGHNLPANVNAFFVDGTQAALKNCMNGGEVAFNKYAPQAVKDLTETALNLTETALTSLGFN